MFDFIFVTLLRNAAWSYFNEFNQSNSKLLEMTAVALILRRFRLCDHAFSKKTLFIENKHLRSLFILIYNSDFGNKIIEVLLQLSEKGLTTCLIKNFSFTIHNYRPSGLQTQSWYSSPGLFLTVWQQESKFCR